MTQVEFAPDGEMLVSGGEDDTTCIWDMQSGEAKEAKQDEAAAVVAGGKFAFAKGNSREQKVGEFLVTAQGDMLRIFKSGGGVKDKADQGTAPVVAFFRAPGSISTVDTSGDQIAVGCENGQVLQLRSAVLLMA